MWKEVLRLGSALGITAGTFTGCVFQEDPLANKVKIESVPTPKSLIVQISVATAPEVVNTPEPLNRTLDQAIEKMLKSGNKWLMVEADYLNRMLISGTLYLDRVHPDGLPTIRLERMLVTLDNNKTQEMRSVYTAPFPINTFLESSENKVVILLHQSALNYKNVATRVEQKQFGRSYLLPEELSLSASEAWNLTEQRLLQHWQQLAQEEPSFPKQLARELGNVKLNYQ